MGARGLRKAAFERLLERNRVRLSSDDTGLQRLDDWYQAHVKGSATEADRLEPRWYAIGLDIGLYLGDAIIDRAPEIEWRLFTQGRRNVSYQRPVLMGFRGVKNPRYNVDPELIVGTHGHRLVVGEDEPKDLFVQLVQSVVEDA